MHFSTISCVCSTRGSPHALNSHLPLAHLGPSPRPHAPPGLSRRSRAPLGLNFSLLLNSLLLRSRLSHLSLSLLVSTRFSSLLSRLLRSPLLVLLRLLRSLLLSPLLRSPLFLSRLLRFPLLVLSRLLRSLLLSHLLRSPLFLTDLLLVLHLAELVLFLRLEVAFHVFQTQRLLACRLFFVPSLSPLPPFFSSLSFRSLLTFSSLSPRSFFALFTLPSFLSFFCCLLLSFLLVIAAI